jgi:fibronectin-binding autotransporter adhesin
VLKRISPWPLLVLALWASVFTSIPAAALAASGTWSNTAGGTLNWDDSGNWASGTIADGADFNANFTANITAALNVNLNNAKSIGNITFTDSGTSSHDMTISGANTLTLDDADIPTINVTQNGRILTITSVIAGGEGLEKVGAGELNLQGNNIYTGGTTISAGRLIYNNNNALSTGDITFTGSAIWGPQGGVDNINLSNNIIINLGVTATNAIASAATTGTEYSGVLSGSGTLVSNTGTNVAANFSNSGNTFSGIVTIGGGNDLTFESLGDTAANDVNLNNGDFIWSGAAKTFTNRQFDLDGTGQGSVRSSGSGALTISKDLGLSGSGNRTFTLGGSNADNNTFDGIIANDGAGVIALTKADGGKWILGNSANTYTGVTSVSGGTLEVADLDNGGADSSMGASTNAASNLVIQRTATLRYTGTGHSTDRLFSTLNPSNVAGDYALDASGTGAINFTNPGAIVHTGAFTGTRTLLLTGTNSDGNTLTPSLGNDGSNLAAVNKTGAGRWILAGTNTYTGTTTITGGVLQAIDGTGLPSASILQLRGGVFQSSGTFTRSVNTSAGGVNWSTSSGGFAAIGGTLNLQFNGGVGSLTWNASSMVSTGQTLIFGSTSADSLVNFQNALNLGSSSSGQRTIRVVDNPNSAIDRARISGQITNNVAGWGILKEGDGILELTNANTFSGASTVSAGTLLVNNISGSGTGSGNVTVNAGATLGGSGTISGVVLGAGLVSPGNSPGILTVGQVDTSTGMDYAFEFTAANVNPAWNVPATSVNDVLRITGATPFTGGDMTASNVIDVYLNVSDLLNGDVFNGGFFTDTNGNFLTTVSGADYNFFVDYDGGGSVVFEGENYYSLLDFATAVDATITLDVSTLQIGTANFPGGDVSNGWVTQFSVTRIENNVVPEPATVVLWSLLGLGLVGYSVHRRRRTV